MPSANSTSEPFTLDKSLPVLALTTLSHPLFVHRYPARTPVPPQLFTGDAPFASVTRAPNELSIVATREAVAEAGMHVPADEHVGGPWTAIRVRGPLEHHMVGVLSEIARVLRDAKVSLFVISTWDTDYILVTTDTLPAARAALEADGWHWS